MEIDPEKYKIFRKEDPIEPIAVAIFDSSKEGTIAAPMDEVKYGKLYESINNAIFADIDKRMVVPSFAGNKYVCGVMKIRCSTPAAKSWLTDMIRYRVTPLWENMQLKVDDFDKLPPQNRILGSFLHCKLSADQIRHILGVMNPKINVCHWIILNSKTSEKRAQVIFDIPESEMDRLSEHKFVLHFGAGYAFFWDVTEGKGEPWIGDEEGTMV